MNIYVSVDMEGIAGVLLGEQLRRGEPLYQEARRLLTDETNAIVQSLVDQGVQTIIVKDAHGSGFNFLVDQLHPGARYCMGGARIPDRFPGLDVTFEGAFLIGYHGMAGVRGAIRDHTMTSMGWQTIELNGEPVGEITLDGLLFGLQGVPLLLVSGDDKTCAEANRFAPWAATYETKAGVTRHAALLKAPKRVYAEIPAAVERALAARATAKPLELQPGAVHELKIRFLSTDQADARVYDDSSRIRLDGLTALYRHTDLVRLLDMAF